MKNLTSEIILCPNECELVHQGRMAALREERILHVVLSPTQLNRGCCAATHVKLIGLKGTEPKGSLIACCLSEDSQLVALLLGLWIYLTQDKSSEK